MELLNLNTGDLLISEEYSEISARRCKNKRRAYEKALAKGKDSKAARKLKKILDKCEGKIELEPLSEVLNPVSMVQIPENALLHDVVKLMEDRELFANPNNESTEKIYTGSIFSDIFYSCCY